MISEQLNLEYDDFIKIYVKSPIMDYTFSFYYKNKVFQFDFVNAPIGKNGVQQYYFVEHIGDWGSPYTVTLYKSLKEAIDKVLFDNNKTFRDVFYSEDSDLIDIS